MAGYVLQRIQSRIILSRKNHGAELGEILAKMSNLERSKAGNAEGIFENDIVPGIG